MFRGASVKALAIHMIITTMCVVMIHFFLFAGANAVQQVHAGGTRANLRGAVECPNLAPLCRDWAQALLQQSQTKQFTIPNMPPEYFC